MFKIRNRVKAKSKISYNELVPHGKLYSCLKTKINLDNEWKNILKSELDMESTIIAFQLVQILGRIEGKKKLAIRRINTLKKSIIESILKADYENFLDELNELKDVSNDYKSLSESYIHFYHLRNQIVEINYEFKEKTKKKLKAAITQLQQNPEKYIQNLVYGRILYIYALHLLRLDGALLRNENIQEISEALNLKKKELCIDNIIKRQVLESLLCFTFEFYRILRLLKRDQHLILYYYNQIKAYINIFRKKVGNYEEFEEIHNVEKKLQTMIPLYLNLKIYDDHQKRKSLSIQNTEGQLLNKHKSQKLRWKKSSQVKKSVQEERKEESDQNYYITELCAGLFDNPQLAATHPEEFNFNFTLTNFGELLIGQFIVQKFIAEKKVVVSITIKRQLFQISKFSFNFSIEEGIHIKQFSQKLWSIVKSIFQTDRSEFLSTLFCFDSPPEKDLPSFIDKLTILPILVRIHSTILHYLRKKPIQFKLNGKHLCFPTLNQEMIESIAKGNEPENRMFSKRLGFISFTKQNPIKSNQSTEELYILAIKVKNNNFNLILLKYENKELKEAEVIQKEPYTLQQYKELNDVFVQVSMLQKINKRKTLKGTKKTIIKLLNSPKKKAQHEEVKDSEGKKKEIKIQEEFEVMKNYLLQTKFDCQKNFWHFSKKKSIVKHSSKKTISTSTSYELMNFQNKETYVKYYNSKYKLYLPTKQSYNLKKLSLKKVRMYKNFLFEESFKNYVKYSKASPQNFLNKNDFLDEKKQKIVLECFLTKVKKINENYFLINFYKDIGENHNNDEIICEIHCLKTFLAYYAKVSRSTINEKLWSFDQKSLILNEKIKMEEIKSNRNLLCDAQIFYDKLR